MLELTNVQKSFGGVKAIRGSTFAVKEGQVTALIGPNGAGKTTLFNIVSGILPQDEGAVLFDGKDISRMPAHRRGRLGLARTFQKVRLFDGLTLEEHFRFAEGYGDTNLLRSFFTGNRSYHERYGEHLEMLGIDRPLNTLASDLSYGQKKLMELGMALLKPHMLLMLDEPVAGVNSVLQARIEELLLDLKKEQHTMLLIDHDMHFIRKLADHVIVLDGGEVLMDGSPDKVLSDPKVLAAYLGE